MKKMIELILMFVGPFCMWYPFFMLACTDWNFGNWHWGARAFWIVLSILTIVQIFKKFGKS